MLTSLGRRCLAEHRASLLELLGLLLLGSPGGHSWCRAALGLSSAWPLSDDHSRVKLSQLGEDPHSDYINANFMPVSAHLPSPLRCGCRELSQELCLGWGSVPFCQGWWAGGAGEGTAGGKVGMCGCPLAGVDGACEMENAVMQSCECGKSLCFLLVDCILFHHLPAYCPVSLPALFPSALCSCL